VALDRARTNHDIGVWLASLARWVLVAMLVVTLVACVSRPGSKILESSGAKRGDRNVTVFVATLRTPEPGSATAFSSGQSQTLRFARYVISIPSTHKTDTRRAFRKPSSAPASPVRRAMDGPFDFLFTDTITAFRKRFIGSRRLPQMLTITGSRCCLPGRPRGSRLAIART
jgi:hypothetical protein